MSRTTCEKYYLALLKIFIGSVLGKELGHSAYGKRRQNLSLHACASENLRNIDAVHHCSQHAIDGVYDSDPKLNPEAKKYDTISIQEVIDKQLAVVDLTASIMCMENHVPMAVFSLNEKDGIANAMQGKINGTVVTA